MKFARYLPAHGYEVVVLTGPGSVADYWAPEDASLGDELPDTLEVHRVGTPEPEASTGIRRRIERVADIRSPFERWWVEGVASTVRRVGPADLIYAAVVPYITAEAAARAARELQIPWVADLQDPWALDEMWLYPTGWHRRRDRLRMGRFLATAEAVIMNTPEATRRVEHAFPELVPKLIPSIPNGFDASDFEGPSRARSDGRFRIVHTGYLHTGLGREHRRTKTLRRLLGGTVGAVDILARSHVYLLEAVDRLVQADPSLADVLEIHFVGKMSDADREVAERSPLTRVYGYRPHTESVDVVRSADLLFLPMHDLRPPARAGLVPGKMYEYLGSGRPILAAVPDGDARDILTAAGNAHLCRPTDVAAMAEAIETEVARWRRGERPPQPKAEVVAQFERRHLTARLAEVLDHTRARHGETEGGG